MRLEQLAGLCRERYLYKHVHVEANHVIPKQPIDQSEK